MFQYVTKYFQNSTVNIGNCETPMAGKERCIEISMHLALFVTSGSLLFFNRLLWEQAANCNNVIKVNKVTKFLDGLLKLWIKD